MDLELSNKPTPLPTQHPTYKHCVNGAYEQKAKIQLNDFFRRACFSSSISTWTQALDKKILRHLARLHLRRCSELSTQIPCHGQRSPQSLTENLRSTSQISPTVSPKLASTVMTTPPSVTEPTFQTHFVYVQVVDKNGQIY
jgi:hypothetical protein